MATMMEMMTTIPRSSPTATVMELKTACTALMRFPVITHERVKEPDDADEGGIPPEGHRDQDEDDKKSINPMGSSQLHHGNLLHVTYNVAGERLRGFQEKTSRHARLFDPLSNLLHVRGIKPFCFHPIEIDRAGKGIFISETFRRFHPVAYMGDGIAAGEAGGQDQELLPFGVLHGVITRRGCR